VEGNTQAIASTVKEMGLSPDQAKQVLSGWSAILDGFQDQFNRAAPGLSHAMKQIGFGSEQDALGGAALFKNAEQAKAGLGEALKGVTEDLGDRTTTLGARFGAAAEQARKGGANYMRVIESVADQVAKMREQFGLKDDKEAAANLKIDQRELEFLDAIHKRH